MSRVQQITTFVAQVTDLEGPIHCTYDIKGSNDFGLKEYGKRYGLSVDSDTREVKLLSDIKEKAFGFWQGTYNTTVVWICKGSLGYSITGSSTVWVKQNLHFLLYSTT